MKIIRVFPRRTKATPIDQDVRINRMPDLFDVADEVHISVAFTWDIPIAERLFNGWRSVAPVKIGGPAFNNPGEDFIPGMYLKNGYTITSRGCINKCWFCSVWKRENGIRELPITPGWIVQDDNLLACSDNHIKAVFEMLGKQRKPAVFSGGIEAKLLKSWHLDLFASIRVGQLFCAYDTPDDLDPLIRAGQMFNEINITFKNRKAMCYVLIGMPGDTFEKAQKRILQTVDAGFMPFAMLWRDEAGRKDAEWGRFQRQWSRPASIVTSCKKLHLWQ